MHTCNTLYNISCIILLLFTLLHLSTSHTYEDKGDTLHTTIIHNNDPAILSLLRTQYFSIDHRKVEGQIDAYISIQQYEFFKQKGIEMNLIKDVSRVLKSLRKPQSSFVKCLILQIICQNASDDVVKGVVCLIYVAKLGGINLRAIIMHELMQ